MPSTKFVEVKEEQQPPFFLLRVEKDGDSPVQYAATHQGP